MVLKEWVWDFSPFHVRMILSYTYLALYHCIDTCRWFRRVQNQSCGHIDLSLVVQG